MDLFVAAQPVNSGWSRSRDQGRRRNNVVDGAAGSGRVKVVEYTFEFDRDLKAQNSRAQTVLHMAVSGPSAKGVRVIQFLATKGQNWTSLTAPAKRLLISRLRTSFAKVKRSIRLFRRSTSLSP
jgi:hypothetical protein